MGCGGVTFKVLIKCKALYLNCSISGELFSAGCLCGDPTEVGKVKEKNSYFYLGEIAIHGALRWVFSETSPLIHKTTNEEMGKYICYTS